MKEVKIGFCHACTEYTPHSSENSELSCQVCLSQPHSSQWFQEADEQWQIRFWKRKYLNTIIPDVNIGVIGMGATINVLAAHQGIIVTEFPHNSTAPVEINIQEIPVPKLNNLKLSAGTLDAGKSYVIPKSKYHK